MMYMLCRLVLIIKLAYWLVYCPLQQFFYNLHLSDDAFNVIVGSLRLFCLVIQLVLLSYAKRKGYLIQNRERGRSEKGGGLKMKCDELAAVALDNHSIIRTF